MNRRSLALGVFTLAALISGCTAGRAKGGEAAAAVTSSSTAGVTTTTAVLKHGGTLIYAASQPPVGFNVNTKAAHTPAALAIMDQVWPSVFHVAPDFTTVLDKNFMTSANLVSGSPETLVLKINPAASWSDGVPITADDFIYFWRQQRDPLHTVDHCTDPNCTTNGKPIDDYSDGAGYRDIKSVTGSDGGKTVTVVFARPYGDWKSLWSDIVPAHLAQKVGWNHGFDVVGDPPIVVSGGPYKIYSYNKGVDLTLVPNDRYWATPPTLDSIVFRVTPDASQQVAALQSQKVDMISQAPFDPALVSAVKAIPGIRSDLGSGTQLNQLYFNLSTPGLDDVVVRRAIATAIDRPSLANAASGGLVPVALANNRIFLSTQPQYRDSSGSLYDHSDVTLARQMLAGDGYQVGADGIYAKGPVRLSFRISTALGGTVGPQTEALLRAQLALAGIEVRIDTAGAPVSLGAAQPSQSFDLAIVSPTISPFPSANVALYASLGAGTADNGVLGKYLAYGAGEVDPASQGVFFNDADALMWQDMWTLPLYRTPTLVAVRNTFLNVQDNPNPDGPFWNAETWGLRNSPTSG